MRNGSASNNSINNSTSSVNTAPSNTISNNAPMGLGGLFAGGMPKLKTTGLRGTIVEKDNQSIPTSVPSVPPTIVTTGTMKRGPPPVPPPAAQKPQISFLQVRNMMKIIKISILIFNIIFITRIQLKMHQSQLVKDLESQC